MPTTPSQLDDVEKPEPEVVSAPAPVKPGAPLSFVPHEPDGKPAAPFRIRTNRFGDLEEHELVRLLDTIEDERARGRFRESIYISVFVWLVVAWVIFYGPKYLWHAPKLISPVEVMKQQQLTSLRVPVLRRPVVPPPKVDTKVLERLRAAEPKMELHPTAPPPPAPPATQPQPVETSAPPPLLPAAPTPARTAPPVIAEAPTPQPTTRPTFNTSGSASDEMRNALRDSSRDHGTVGGVHGGVSAPGGAKGDGGVQVLSDMQGVDFSEYLKRLQREIMRNWIPLLPEETESPLFKKGETYIVVTILPDGKIGDMHLDGSSHDVAIDKAAWGSILSEGQFQALPSQFHGPNLILRFHYIVNGDIR
jgi:outer membrane biosynthesis protein TonB